MKEFNPQDHSAELAFKTGKLLLYVLHSLPLEIHHTQFLRNLGQTL